MAKRSRKSKSTRPSPLPIPSPNLVTGGRLPPVSLSRSRLEPLRVLPNPLPNPLPEVIRRVREFRAARFGPVAFAGRARVKTRSIPLKLAGQRIKQELRKLSEVRLPYLARKAPCEAREARRAAMFARGVAGKKWGRGGPHMKNARHTLDSTLSCRR